MNLEFRRNPVLGGTAPLKVWEYPNPEERYVLGADVAEGLEHGDYSCAQVLSVKTGHQVACWHGHIPADLFGEEVDRLGRWFNEALVCVEANNHGLTTITKLRNLNYPRLFRMRSLNRASNTQTMEFGWKTTIRTKPLVVDELGAALREGAVTVRDFHTVGELKTYTRNEKGHTSGSPFDDRVIALGLAVQMLKYAHQPEYQPTVDPYMTGQWWGDLIQPSPRGNPIGVHAMRSPQGWPR